MNASPANPLLDHALAYALQGWPVHPLLPASKKPATPNGFKDSTTDEKQIREWWGKNKNYNIGLQTGVAFFALDIDIKNGGTETLEELEAKHGKLPETLQQITGSGGRHYLFELPNFEVKCSAGQVGDGLDIRGAGGYIMAAPSIHPVTKKAYDWDGMGEYNDPILPAPDWLLELVQGKQIERRAKKIMPDHIVHGEQHDWLVSYAGYLRNRGGFEEEIYEAIKTSERLRCEVIGPDENLRQIARSMMKYDPGYAPLIAMALPENPGDAPVGNPRWAGLIQMGPNGTTPKPNLNNCILTLTQAPEWCGRIVFDEFHQTMKARKDLPCGVKAGAVFKDHYFTFVAAYFQREYNIQCSSQMIAEACLSVARENPVHEVREYLSGIEWDGIPRLNDWLTDYLGCDDNRYTRAVGRKWLISGAARIMNPGCKADHMLILEGPQGLGKSTALKVLGGAWFDDGLKNIGDKDAAIQLAGKWIMEVAELDGFSRSDANEIKSFVTRSTDRYRPPYGKTAVDHDRQCIFAGTTNSEEYLKDVSGGRRFWPVRCRAVTRDGRIDRDRLMSVRDQLWAEAVAAFNNGESWYLQDAEVEKLAMVEQSERYDEDPWQQIVEIYCQDRETVTADEILEGQLDSYGHVVNGIGKKREQWSIVDRKRVVSILKRMGYDRKSVKRNGRTTWGYQRAA